MKKRALDTFLKVLLITLLFYVLQFVKPVYDVFTQEFMRPHITDLGIFGVLQIEFFLIYRWVHIIGIVVISLLTTFLFLALNSFCNKEGRRGKIFYWLSLLIILGISAVVVSFLYNWYIFRDLRCVLNPILCLE